MFVFFESLSNLLWSTFFVNNSVFNFLPVRCHILIFSVCLYLLRIMCLKLLYCLCVLSNIHLQSNMNYVLSYRFCITSDQ